MSFMSTATSWLIDTLQDADPYTATYTDDSTAIQISLIVWLGRKVHLQLIEGKGRVEFVEFDVMIKADELLVSGSKITPARGDRIALTLNGTVKTLEVMSPQSGETPWRYSDSGEKLLRVHLKRTG